MHWTMQNRFTTIELLQYCSLDKQTFNLFDLIIYFLEMIPAIPDLDNSWSEFERYSTNDYIRQLLEAKTNEDVSRMTTAEA